MFQHFTSCLYLLLLSLMNILHDIGRFCKSFFRVFMRPCGGGVGSLSVTTGTLECWQTQKAGSGFLGLLSCCAYLTHDFEGVVFSGVNLMALNKLGAVFLRNLMRYNLPGKQIQDYTDIMISILQPKASHVTDPYFVGSSGTELLAKNIPFLPRFP